MACMGSISNLIPTFQRGPSLCDLEQARLRTDASGGSVRAPAAGNTDLRSTSGLQSIEQLLGVESLLGGDADLAFIVFALQIQQMDRNVADEIKRVDATGKLRDAINDQLDKLRQLKSYIMATNGCDNDNQANRAEIYTQAKLLPKEFADIPSPPYSELGTIIGSYRSNATKESGFKAPPSTAELNDASKAFLEADQKASSQLAMQQKDFYFDPKTGTVKIIEGKDLGHWDNENSFLISETDVETEIKRLETQAQKLDSDREIRMIMLNQQLNKKEQAVTQLTNIIKKTHDTKSAIISNLK